MHKKIVLSMMLFSSTQLLPMGCFSKAFACFSSQKEQSTETKVQLTKTAKQLVVLAESMNAYDKAYAQWQGAVKNFELMNDVNESISVIKHRIKIFEVTKKINGKDLKSAQGNLPWLEEPIGQYLMRKLVHEHWSTCGYGGRAAVLHLGLLLAPYSSTKDILILQHNAAHQRTSSRRSKKIEAGIIEYQVHPVRDIVSDIDESTLDSDEEIQQMNSDLDAEMGWVILNNK